MFTYKVKSSVCIKDLDWSWNSLETIKIFGARAWWLKEEITRKTEFNREPEARIREAEKEKPIWGRKSGNIIGRNKNL